MSVTVTKLDAMSSEDFCSVRFSMTHVQRKLLRLQAVQKELPELLQSVQRESDEPSAPRGERAKAQQVRLQSLRERMEIDRTLFHEFVQLLDTKLLDVRNRERYYDLKSQGPIPHCYPSVLISR